MTQLSEKALRWHCDSAISYAIRYWLDHTIFVGGIDRIPDCLRDSLLNFLVSNNVAFEEWRRLFPFIPFSNDLFDSFFWYSQPSLRSFEPLHLVAAFGLTDIIRDVLNNTKDVNKADCTKRTAFAWAAKQGHAEVAKILLEHPNIDVNECDNTGRTALVSAAKEGDYSGVKFLLDHHSTQVNKTDRAGRTALIWAAMEGHANIVELILDRRDTNINHKDNGGQTALSWAAEFGKADVVDVLLKMKKHKSTSTQPIIAAEHRFGGQQKRVILGS